MHLPGLEEGIIYRGFSFEFPSGHLESKREHQSLTPKINREKIY